MMGMIVLVVVGLIVVAGLLRAAANLPDAGGEDGRVELWFGGWDPFK